MAIYMKYGSIDGDSTTKGWEKWIKVQSLQWGVGRGIASPTAGVSKRESSAASVSEIVVVTTMDIHSPKLLQESLTGMGTEVKIHMTRTDSKGEIAFLKYILSDTMVSSYSVSSSGERPMESMSLNFAKVDSEYLNIDTKGGMATTGHVIYDIGKSTLG